MNWIEIDTVEKLEEAYLDSDKERVLLVKYSPACIVNYLMKSLLEREWWNDAMRMKTYIINPRTQREISDKIAFDLGVKHESPQAIVIENRKAVYSASHGKMLVANLKQFAN
ncbi:MAG: bacillithiol system redox-active protein YtxJ [Ignavibacteria bacterium]|nr:bacillithiol system redox-active protein YtxJ [Ignavibacteria bacterium]